MGQEKVYASYELADMGTRLIAAIIDGLILGLVSSIVFSILRDPGGVVSLILFVAYDWYFWTRHNGQTPGKSLMKIRVCDDWNPLAAIVAKRKAGR